MNFIPKGVYEYISNEILKPVNEKIEILEKRIKNLEKELTDALERADKNRIHCKYCGSNVEYLGKIPKTARVYKENPMTGEQSVSDSAPYEVERCRCKKCGYEWDI
jgi:DNA-directed RNA polymerase subunit RPC12/RpoP